MEACVEGSSITPVKRDWVLQGGLVKGPWMEQKFEKHRGMQPVTQTDMSL